MLRFDVQFRVNGTTQTITRLTNIEIRAGSKTYWYAVFEFEDDNFTGAEE